MNKEIENIINEYIKKYRPKIKESKYHLTYDNLLRIFNLNEPINMTAAIVFPIPNKIVLEELKDKKYNEYFNVSYLDNIPTEYKRYFLELCQLYIHLIEMVYEKQNKEEEVSKVSL